MKFNITIEIDEAGRYVVECTDLPGCLSVERKFFLCHLCGKQMRREK